VSDPSGRVGGAEVADDAANLLLDAIFVLAAQLHGAIIAYGMACLDDPDLRRP
jgi:hypothetical protein